MDYMELVTSMLNILVSASMYEQQKNEPGIAVLNIEAANELLPPGRNGKGGYRADLEKLRPPLTDHRKHDNVYLSESLKQTEREWAYYRAALKAVMEQISRYAHDRRDEFADQIDWMGGDLHK